MNTLLALIYDKSNTPSLKHIVLMMKTLPADLQIRAQKSDIILNTLDDVEKLGKEYTHIHNIPPRPDDLCVICFTSGTTGKPKGVMLTHGNTIACSTTADTFVYSRINVNDIQISYLPLAHMFERCLQSVVFSEGGRVGAFLIFICIFFIFAGFYRGDREKILDDVKEVSELKLFVQYFSAKTYYFPRCSNYIIQIT